jgi:hypothetical protein
MENIMNLVIVVTNTMYLVLEIFITKESIEYPNIGLMHQGKSIMPPMRVMASGLII